MNIYKKSVDIRWSDLDPNYHLRHSVYYDWGAFTRLSFLNEHDMTPAFMTQHHIGPVIFREEAIFKKEIHFGDTVEVFLYLQKCKSDMSRWTMKHDIYKNGDTLSAILTVDGAWIDTKIRKLATPPEFVFNGFNAIPKAKDFEWIP
jgi:acyl-CoA thioester hydrolase